MEGMPGSAAGGNLQSHRYAGFAENGDDDSDEDEDIGHAFEMVRYFCTVPWCTLLLHSLFQSSHETKLRLSKKMMPPLLPG